MLRARFDHRIEVKSLFLGMEEGEKVPGSIVSVESYKGSPPTFTWLSSSGHLFAYLPSSAFGPEDDLGTLVDFHCPDNDIDATNMALQGPGWGLVGDKPVNWKTYLLTVDWPNANQLAHLVLGFKGELIWLRNSRFQVGGTSFSPPTWKKARRTWQVLK